MPTVDLSMNQTIVEPITVNIPNANIPIICVPYDVSPLVNGTISVPHIPANK